MPVRTFAAVFLLALVACAPQPREPVEPQRMVAAVGNRVEDVGGLHRSRIGQLVLPADLKAGEWRWLTAADLLAIANQPV